MPRSSCVIALLATLAAAPALAQQPAGRRDVILATTTSFQDTGLLDSLAPLLERATGHRIRVIAVGSGQALRMGERGDADLVLAHAPAAEEAFMAAGHGLRRRQVASNYFTIVGPPGDPAGVRDAVNAADALGRIARGGFVFASRGDSSGTHQRELALWRAAGGLTRWPGYLETGQGMAPTLLVAGERRGYALTDRSTFAALGARTNLVVLREREPALRNVYSVIELNGEGRPRMNVAGGRAVADFLVSPAAQAFLASYGTTRFGAPLFEPALNPPR